MAQRNMLAILSGAIDKLDNTLDSAEVALNGAELATFEDVVNDLKDVRTRLVQFVEALGGDK